jgi:tripartite-type tricarboxylate transporter receptor subunit TctC
MLTGETEMKPFSYMRRVLVAAVAVTLGLVGVGDRAAAEDFPSKPVTMIIPYGAGGSTDIMGRVFAQALGDALGQPVVVVNRKGAGGAVGASFLKSADPDGYTILLGGIDDIAAWMPSATQVDFTAQDFRFIGAVANYQNALVAPLDQPFSSLAEFVEYAKANPGAAVVAQGGLDAKFIERMAKVEGLDLRTVRADGGAEAMQLLLAGNAVLSYSGGAHATYEQQIGVLASLNETRLSGAPDKPTFKEAGYGLAMPSLIGIMAPAGVSDDVAAIIEQAVVKAAGNEDFRVIVEDRLKSKVEVLSGAEAAAVIAEMAVALAPLAAE